MSSVSISHPNKHTLKRPVSRRLGAAFAGFVVLTDRLVRAAADGDPALCAKLQLQLQPLLLDGSWIPSELTSPTETPYRRECLYEALDGAFSIGVFTWVPGHISRIHDHHSWAVLGNLTGVLRSENFLAVAPGRVFKHAVDDLLQPAQSLWSTQATGDIHRVSVASIEKSTSIHIYGCPFDTVNREYYVDIAEETGSTA